MDLFKHAAESRTRQEAPLADRVRPTRWEEFVGQAHLVGEEALLRKAVQAGKPFSMILWGPPGTGKTTLAEIAARAMEAHLVTFSAVLAGVKDVRHVLDEARQRRTMQGLRTILFVDELHRFNKAQQDAFLPHVERGDILLFGATTENPSFEINAALLSRCQVFLLHPLRPEEIVEILKRALQDKDRGLGNLKVHADDNALQAIAESAGGDARVGLNMLESLVSFLASRQDRAPLLTAETVQEFLLKHPLLYDKAGEEHFNLISALHKSLRGGDPDASLYWLGRMLEAGEDPLYVARRLVRFASEDVGLADPQALSVAIAARDAFHFLGPPEGFLALAQAAVYLALAPKSNSIYRAYGKVQEAIGKHGPLPVPLAIRNAPTPFMRNLGYGRDYRYPHDDPDRVVDQQYLPDGIGTQRFYHPSDQGQEKIMAERLRRWYHLRRIKQQRDAE
jgi:putative ATPase